MKDHGASKLFIYKRASWWQRVMIDTWLPKFIAIFLSASCLCGIVLALLYFNQKPTPDLPYGVTLNAVIAILATTSRSILIYVVASAIGQLKWCWFKQRKRKLQDVQRFDDASRGPWGALGIMFSLHLRSTASFLGALVTILALGFDPSVQQILTYPNRMVFGQGAVASAKRAPVFMFGGGSDEWLTAIDAGIRAEKSEFDQEPVCATATGACTWEPFQSVGWCSKCVNTTAHAKISTCDTTQSAFLNDSKSNCVVDYGHGNTLSLLGPGSNVSYNDGVITGYDPTVVAEALWVLDDVLIGYNWSGLMLMSNETYAGVQNPAIALGHVTVSADVNVEGDAKLNLVLAEECVLSLCERTLTLSMENGTLDVYSGSDQYGAMTSNWTDGKLQACWQPDSAFAISTPRNVSCGFMEPESSVFCTPGLATGCSNMEPNSSYYAGSLAERLAGNVTTNFNAMVNSMYGFASYSSPEMSFIATRNFSSIMEGVAASLSALSLTADTAEQVLGNALVNETYVSVAWILLALPAGVVLGAILTLLAAVVQTRRCKIRLWKSSVLPLLYHGLDPDLDCFRRQGTPEEVSGMMMIAEKAKVEMAYSARRQRTMMK